MSCLSQSVDRMRCQKPQGVCEDAQDATDHRMYRVWFSDGQSERRIAVARHLGIVAACLPTVGSPSRSTVLFCDALEVDQLALTDSE
jgi:hypothetical protein